MLTITAKAAVIVGTKTSHRNGFWMSFVSKVNFCKEAHGNFFQTC